MDDNRSESSLEGSRPLFDTKELQNRLLKCKSNVQNERCQLGGSGDREIQAGVVRNK